MLYTKIQPKSFLGQPHLQTNCQYPFGGKPCVKSGENCSSGLEKKTFKNKMAVVGAILDFRLSSTRQPVATL